jgi:signal recognition particle receptor subunit beta
MVLFNYSTRELTAKVVYYGPGICGKTTNLQFIHENLPGEVRGKMLALATKTDRTLFFDFLPIDLGEIRGMKTRVQLYTVPGQVFYNETRKLVLKGVDGIVFVADSQETMLGANVESFKNLEENLKAHGMKLSEIPHVIQFNKRDLPKLSGIEDMNAALNKYNAPFYESVATTGIGVQDTLKAIVKLVLLNLTKKYEPKSVPAQAGAAASPASPVASMASTASGRAATPAAEPPVAAQAIPPSPRAQVPVSTVQPSTGSQRTGAAVPPGPRKGSATPVETMPPFRAEEIDGLVDEVEEFAPPMAAAPLDDTTWMGSDDDATMGSSVPIEDLLRDSSPVPATRTADEASWKPDSAPASGFELDRGFDPEWDAPVAPAAAKHVPSRDSGAAAGAGAARDAVLTEVASDDDLFSDPSLEIAHLTDGQAREIIVPVVLGQGPSARRYKFAIRLRLDPVD